ncbi:hypothetical protein BAY61_19635 [Prauserella marina]|uniref:sensor histidine kinase n=1 Tax=Prauserella marina TaxID=530584 RepID=UPI000B8D526E|nr:sensor histidine kinase [Prauserella marina]ASR36836.1 hypothetical protein BAY61_19635 [Prauserella marina]PWV80245.1 signal transduction histidine kinase [Prauserella marina]
MPTFLVDRLFDRRMTPVRVAVLSALSAGYIFLVADIGHPGHGGWLVLLAALVVSWGSPRWPLVCALCQTGLLALGEVLGADTVVPLKVLASFALFELAMRTTGKWLAVTGLALGAVYLAAGIAHSDKDVAGVVFQTAVVVGGPMVLGAFIGGVRARAGLAEQRAAEQERLRHSEARMARVAERTAIARELHDLVAHHVASIVLRAGVARHLLPSDGDPRIREVLDDVHDTGSSALTDLRRLVTVLRDPATSETAGGDLVDPAELPIAISAAVERARQSGLAVDATVDPALSGLDPVTGLAVLRFIQEGLANVVKHAGPASAVTLSATVRDDTVGLSLVDDGSGVSTDPAPDRAEGERHGLIGMRERIELLGGTLRAGPEGGGWRLAAGLPATATLGDPVDGSDGTGDAEHSGRSGDSPGSGGSGDSRGSGSSGDAAAPAFPPP